MKYEVLSRPGAEQDLADVWLNAKDRRRVVSAAEFVDRLLEQDAHTRGESRYGDFRILFVSPLGVTFEVYVEDRLAEVVAVWSIR